MKTFQGTVVSTKMDKTAVVSVDRSYSHPLYGKIIRVNKKYFIHDEENKAKEGDSVIFTESRPRSKNKRFALVEIKK